MLCTFIGMELQQILNDSAAEVDSNSSDFWVLVAALKVGASVIAIPALLHLMWRKSYIFKIIMFFIGW